MGYIEANLLPDETVVHKATLHWLIFGKATLVAAAGLLLLVLVEPTVGALVLAIGLVMAVPAWVAYRTSEFGVTTKRVIVKVGLVRRRTLELLLRQVEAISIDQSLMGRIFNYGSVTLSGTGGVREVFHNIAAPLEFRRKIQSQTA
ncbi:MAG: PH domain-containing protein [Acidobacteria bacterium]|nr:PH domain-containing protein [Acidobacteriota bacterium]